VGVMEKMKTKDPLVNGEVLCSLCVCVNVSVSHGFTDE
jgi:hypothetical protein